MMDDVVTNITTKEKCSDGDSEVSQAGMTVKTSCVEE